MTTNSIRIGKAANALADYDYKTEGMDAVTDLVSDLRHFAASEGIDFDAIIRISGDHYETEQDSDLDPEVKPPNCSLCGAGPFASWQLLGEHEATHPVAKSVEGISPALATTGPGSGENYRLADEGKLIKLYTGWNDGEEGVYEYLTEGQANDNPGSWVQFFQLKDVDAAWQALSDLNAMATFLPVLRREVEELKDILRQQEGEEGDVRIEEARADQERELASTVLAALGSED